MFLTRVIHSSFARLPLSQVRHGGSISVILIQDMEKRGVKGDIIKVKRGFARNLLIPRKIAG